MDSTTGGTDEVGTIDVESIDALDASDSFDDFNKAMGADGDASPYPLLADLRTQAPIHRGIPEFGIPDDPDLPPTFSAFSYEAVSTVLGDGTTFSSSGYSEVMGQVLGRSILEMDEPEHHTYRTLLQHAFTKHAMQRWETELVTPLVDRMIDAMLAGDRPGTDLVAAMFFPLPIRIIAALLGLPEQDLPEFHRLAVEVIGVTADMDRAIASSATLRDYFAGILAERRADPREDMISVLAEAELDGQRLTDEEIYSFLRLLLPAGAETTSRSSASLVFGLLTHTDQLEALRADRALMGQAIEEGIRWEPPLLTIMRLAVQDGEVCGLPIPSGATVLVNMGSANRDPDRWDDPDEFDIFRKRKPHIGFGHGPHLCLGMHLARMETTVMVNRLLDRLPGLRLDPDAPAPFVSGMLFRSPPRLDVVWDA